MSISPGLAIGIIIAYFWLAGFACGYAWLKHDMTPRLHRLIRRILGGR